LTRTRLTSRDRYEQVVTAAVTAFARGGYAGTTTDQVARLAGVSQPYVIRLFGTKQALFLAAATRATDRIEQGLRDAVTGAERDPRWATHDGLLAERESITVLLHGFVIGNDPVIGPAVRDCLGRIHHTIKELTGADEAGTSGVLATGMLLAVLCAMRVVGPDAVTAEPWMTALVGRLLPAGALLDAPPSPVAASAQHPPGVI
jgi:AcrR family transcriptional regulator